MNVRHESVITSSVSCRSSLLLIVSLIKELTEALVLDVVEELPHSLMVKSIFSLSVVAESESLVGVAALVGTGTGFLTKV